ncbi:DNA-binding response regulator [Ktedonobacter sp. SOSP1-85]|uniref:response regulator transcription factor n=1 Tax=Ktedonobacter sp. SOSP1-85 TaxID=2778367 RepID=UPI001A32A00E|nr:response regulator transcription factor [Ktedonobacter sp. SOSP1-85]GHO78521.1 DNA-binding response regulator [Ktedonobacter sp. SOSP1-85]
MSEEKIRVLIVDDQRLMREGLRIILEGAPDIELVGEAENGLSALQIAESQEPDVILMDIRMPVLDGIAATERVLQQALKRPRILLLTTFDTPELVIEGMRAGASGYLLKDCSAEELCTAIRAVARGQVLLQASSAAQLLASLQTRPAALEATPLSVAEQLGLTTRELEVVRLVTLGQSNTEIAATLFVSEATVKTHINHIFSKLGARNRSQAIIKARQLGLSRE